MKFIFYRLTQMIAIITFLSVALFALLSAMPGNPVDMLIMSNPRVKPEDVVRLKKLRGLDKPWYVQYVRWIWGYNEPFRPVILGEMNPIELQLSSEQPVAASLDLEKILFNNDYRLQLSEAKQLIETDRPDLWQNIEANADLKNLSENTKVDLLLEQIAVEDLNYYKLLRTEIHKRSLKELKVSGLLGAKADHFKVTQEFAKPGHHRMWFKITNKAGLETVGSTDVLVDSSLKAKAPTQNLVIHAIPSKIVESPENFKVDLSSYVQNIRDENAKYKFKLLEGSPGSIDDEGIYTNDSEGQGQKAILFAVTDENKNSAKGAFSVEMNPVPNPDRFNNGFLFAFTGDKNALGFSNTYKRPVWELLAGPAASCGDGNIDAGETCDDGNWVSGDGCSAQCQSENLSTFAKMGSTITGYIVSSGRIGNTLQLMIPAILLSLLIAIPLGILSAYRQYSWLDYIVNFFAFIGISLPVFWFGIMVIYIFAETLQWFPAGGMQTPSIQEEGLPAVLSDRISHAILPTLVLSIAYIGRWLRYMRASMLEILPADYIRTARAKGLSEKIVILKHALRNALIPVVTILALSVPALFGGAVLTETVFAWPGIGRLEYDAIVNSDYYVAIVVFLISAFLVMIGNLLADLLYVIVDPRMRN